MDPAEIRLKNFISEDAFPITTLGGANYDSGDYALALNKALEEANYQFIIRSTNPTTREPQNSH